MKMNNIVKGCGTFKFHILALCIVFIWAVTFISTKQLLISGLSPSDILFYRFILAYIGLCVCSHPFVPVAKSLKDEFMLFMCGLFGGTLYFITENTALEFTLVSNVALICSTTPLITLLFQSIIDRKRPKTGIIAGSLFSLFGVAAVIFNTNFIIRINPIGDLLCLASAVSWTLYTLIIKKLSMPIYGIIHNKKNLLLWNNNAHSHIIIQGIDHISRYSFQTACYITHIIPRTYSLIRMFHVVERMS